VFVLASVSLCVRAQAADSKISLLRLELVLLYCLEIGGARRGSLYRISPSLGPSRAHGVFFAGLCLSVGPGASCPLCPEVQFVSLEEAQLFTVRIARKRSGTGPATNVAYV